MSLKPILFDEETKIAFFHIRHLNLIVLGTACQDINTFMVFAFLHKFVDVLKSYFSLLEIFEYDNNKQIGKDIIFELTQSCFQVALCHHYSTR